MGKKLDALLGRNFKVSKFRPLVNLAFSRLAVLKHQRQVRYSQARSDVLQLLQLGHQERALLRVEQVIKERNLLDVYDMIEGYCNVLIERINLLEGERECPDELKEAIAGLIFASSRCGDFPELLEIRAILTSHYGKEFAARAVELRNNCGVSPVVIKKLSTRQPSLENRMEVLKEIASENSIVLQIGQASAVPNNEEILDSPHQHMKPCFHVDMEADEKLQARTKYKDVADAAQAAFESAAYAAAAARAAVELSRAESHDPDDQNSPGTHRGNSPIDEVQKLELETKSQKVDIHEEERPTEVQQSENAEAELKRSMSISSSGSAETKENEIVYSVSQADPAGKDSDMEESENDAGNQKSSGAAESGVEEELKTGPENIPENIKAPAVERSGFRARFFGMGKKSVFAKTKAVPSC